MKPLLRFSLIVLGVVLVGLAAQVPLRIPPSRERTAFAQQRQTEAGLRQMLELQAEDWNRGDIEAFLQSYWRSPELTFAASGGIERGWENVLARYKRVYPDRAAMGHLTFSQLEITPLGDDAALVLGHWELQREKDNPGGVFTLVARRLPEGWRIIHDHTSARCPPNKSDPCLPPPPQDGGLRSARKKIEWAASCGVGIGRRMGTQWRAAAPAKAQTTPCGAAQRQDKHQEKYDKAGDGD